ncbi:MAG: hypothetical protein K5622_00835 [Endomicrobiaceae bacterium]|nr:hypothetical protein [Endomicrobiaceae bacterium]
MKKLKKSFYKFISLFVIACFMLNIAVVPVYAKSERRAKDNKEKNEQVMESGKTDTSEVGLVSAQEAMKTGSGEGVGTMNSIGNMSEEEVDSIIEIDEEGGVIKDKTRGNKVVAVYNAEKEQVLGYAGQSDIVYYQALVNRKKAIEKGAVSGTKEIERIGNIEQESIRAEKTAQEIAEVKGTTIGEYKQEDENNIKGIEEGNKENIEVNKEYKDVVSELSKQTGVSEEEVKEGLKEALAGKSDEEKEGIIGLLGKFFAQGGSVINCAVEALGEVLNIASKGVLGLQALLVEISIGLFEKNNASLIESGDTQLMTSMETMKEMMELYEQEALGIAKTTELFTKELNEGESAIVWVNENHYITVAKQENGNYTISDPNVNGGKTVEYSAEGLKTVLSGGKGTDVNGKETGISYEGLGKDGKIRVLTASEGLKKQIKEGKAEALSTEEMNEITGAIVVINDSENGNVKKSSTTAQNQTDSGKGSWFIKEDKNDNVNNNSFQEVVNNFFSELIGLYLHIAVENCLNFTKNVFNNLSTKKEEKGFLSDDLQKQLYVVSIYGYLQNNNTYFAPKSLQDCQQSIDFSNSPEVLEKVQQAFALYNKKFGTEIDTDTKVIFMYGSNAETNSACACCDINTIIIPIDDFDKPNAQDIFGNIAHEYTHILNYSKVQNGQMTAMEDEVMATENGIIADTSYSKNLTLQTQYNGQQTVNFVSGMELLCFYSILDNQDEIVQQFKQLTGDENIQFNDIYYNDVLFGENNLGIPDSKGLSSTEVGISLEYNGTKILYVTDTGIDINKTYKNISVDGEISHRIETLSMVKDKEIIETTMGNYTNDTFTKQDIIDSFELVTVSTALIEACGREFGFSTDSLQYINYDFPIDSAYSENGDVVRFYLIDEDNNNTYSVDVKKDMGIVQLDDVTNNQSIWNARYNFSKPIEEKISASDSTQNSDSIMMSYTFMTDESQVSNYEYIHDLSNGALQQIVNDSDSDVTTRYLAFLELKEKGKNVAVPNDMKEAAKKYLASLMTGEETLIAEEEETKGLYENATDKLKAALAMVYDTMLDSYIEEFDIDADTVNQIWSDIYNNTEIKTHQDGFAISSLSFQVEAMMPDIMAHELMHNITDVYLGKNKNLTAKSLGEFSSDVAGIVLCKQLGVAITQDSKDEYKEEAGYMRTGATPIEEHHLARGVIGLLIETSIDLEKSIDWDGMMSAVAQCFKSDNFMNIVSSNDYSQSIAKILTQYIAVSGGNPAAVIVSAKNETSELCQNILKMFNFAQF